MRFVFWRRSRSPSPLPSPQGEGEPRPVLIRSLPALTSCLAAWLPLLGERVRVRGNGPHKYSIAHPLEMSRNHFGSFTASNRPRMFAFADWRQRVIEAHCYIANEQSSSISNLQAGWRAFDQTVGLESR